MNIKNYIALFAAGSAVAWAAWVLVLLNIDPVAVGAVGFIVFHLTLFFSATGTFTTIMTLLRIWLYKDRSPEHIVITSLRQGFLLSMLFTGGLLLVSQQLFTIWSVLLLVALSVLIEFIAVSLQKKEGD